MDGAETLGEQTASPKEKKPAKEKKPPKPKLTRAEKIEANVIAGRIGERLAFHRKEKGLSQAEVAEQLGISSESVSRHELGFTNITLARLTDFAHLLGFDLISVLQGISVSVHPIDEVQPLLTAMEGLPAKKRALVIKTALELAQMLHE